MTSQEKHVVSADGKLNA